MESPSLFFRQCKKSPLYINNHVLKLETGQSSLSVTQKHQTGDTGLGGWGEEEEAFHSSHHHSHQHWTDLYECRTVSEQIK
ncbi:hypothetical protein XELAEV_18014155mg [Xenopus laevis]|uniref:Uncharacterized protein n=1 Tax=Xenopus laevis TaxID=8355 RepID=A0A974HUV2_XENLA|nr:hypothetical protein XELAEV_18014155mg [Xenopus laevis]